MKTAPAPLRRIIGHVDVQIAPGVYVMRECLECGHVVSIRHDAYGATAAYRRRCKQCARAAPPGPMLD